MKLDTIVADALKELAAADAAHMATFRLEREEGDDLEAERDATYDRREAARERVLNLAKAMFPPPPPPKRRAKAKPARAPIGRQLPPARVEVTIIDDAPRPVQRSLLNGGGS